MRTPADALRDPRPGDVVKGVPRESWGALHTTRVTCRSVVGECIAYTLNDSSDVHWMLKEWWGKPNRVCESYEVLHVAQEGGEG